MQAGGHWKAHIKMDQILFKYQKPMSKPTSSKASLIGKYSDCTTSAIQELGVAHDILSRAEKKGKKDYLLLHTCQRIELYGSIDKLPNLEHVPNACIPKIKIDENEIPIRLTQIAVGIKSEIIGESFIQKQLHEAREYLADDSPIANIVDTSLNLATRLREIHSFNAHWDYPRVAYDLLGATDAPTGIVIIGSGLLAQALAASAENYAYKSIIAITRTPKRLRKRYKHMPKIKVMTLSQFKEIRDSSEWNLVIATNNYDSEYKDSISQLIDDKQCKSIVDLGSIPIRNSAEGRYYSMYCREYYHIIRNQNKKMEIKINDVNADILNYFRNVS